MAAPALRLPTALIICRGDAGEWAIELDFGEMH